MTHGGLTYFHTGVISRPSRVSISLSLLMVEPDVVSILPVILALAPDVKVSSPSFFISARPPASLMPEVGLIYLNIAIVPLH